MFFDSAIYYKLPLVPAYLGLSEDRKDTISTGMNYASAGCGILRLTGKIAVSFTILKKKKKKIFAFGFEKS